jgi:hypothetical protein
VSWTQVLVLLFAAVAVSPVSMNRAPKGAVLTLTAPPAIATAHKMEAQIKRACLFLFAFFSLSL